MESRGLRTSASCIRLTLTSSTSAASRSVFAHAQCHSSRLYRVPILGLPEPTLVECRPSRGSRGNSCLVADLARYLLRARRKLRHPVVLSSFSETWSFHSRLTGFLLRSKMCSLASKHLFQGLQNYFLCLRTPPAVLAAHFWLRLRHTARRLFFPQAIVLLGVALRSPLLPSFSNMTATRALNYSWRPVGCPVSSSRLGVHAFCLVEVVFFLRPIRLFERTRP